VAAEEEAVLSSTSTSAEVGTADAETVGAAEAVGIKIWSVNVFQ
jgi:hypothetical protein